ncbi:MAG: hypothetical protein ACRDYA_14660 [Egibacteraceae bacterium]
MGVTLRYAKVVDRDLFLRTGGTVRPGLANEIRLVEDEAPARAAPFLVLRAWDEADGAFTETWRLVDPHGRTVRPSTMREVLQGQTEISDEIADQRFEYADDSYQLVLEVDDREVARANFPVLPWGHAI